MPLFVLGFIFAVGLFIYYLISTSGGGEKQNRQKPRKSDDVRTDDNVIYLTGDIDKIKKDHNIGGKDK